MVVLCGDQTIDVLFENLLIQLGQLFVYDVDSHNLAQLKVEFEQGRRLCILIQHLLIHLSRKLSRSSAWHLKYLPAVLKDLPYRLIKPHHWVYL